jgi:hypothetical protein
VTTDGYDDILTAAPVPDAAFESAADGWLRTEATAAFDALKSDRSRGIPAEEVRAGFEAKWAAGEHVD